MSDIFDEVDEEVRRSRAEQLWKRYGWLVIGLCATVVLGVAGYRGYQWSREQAVTAAGEQFESALADLAAGRAEEAGKVLRAIADSPAGGYGVLARFRLAGETAKRDPAAGLTAFDALAADQAIDAVIRDMARLRAGAIAVDASPLAEVERRLGPLTSAQNAFRHQANELIGVAAIKAGDHAKAQRHLDAIIIDGGAPSDVRDRAGLLIGVARGVK
jgi:hypothetical protein